MAADLPALGFGLPVSGSWATPATMVAVARRAEALGYRSVWTFQRLLQPLVDEPVAGNPGARPVEDPAYRAVHDALLPLAFVAGHTEHLRLGTATICAPFTPPVVLAKALTTLDHLCGGRSVVGLGAGWLPQEYLAAGVPFQRRGARLEEHLRCLYALWADDPVQFAGEFYTVPPGMTGLKPVQRPRPPVLLGGAAPAALRRAGRLADGWICSTGADLTRIGEAVELVRGGAREVGRDPAAVQVVVRTAGDQVGTYPGVGRRPLCGNREQVLDDLARLAALGVTEVLVDLNFSPRVGSPDLDAADGAAEAERVLVALAPG